MKISPTQSDFLNWSRWVAAWLVVAEHARSLVFVEYSDLQDPGPLAKAFYFLTGFGHEAVMVFFVISGFLVGGKVWSLHSERRFQWKRYLADRMSRLFAVLFVALLLGAILDWVGYLYLNKYGLYNHGYQGAIAVFRTAPIDQMGWEDLLVNALFMQTILGPTYGSNGPLWSLAYEWWYYILFPLLLGSFVVFDLGNKRLMKRHKNMNTDNPKLLKEIWGRRSKDPSPLSRLYSRAVCLIAFTGLCCLLTSNMLILFGVWLLGVGGAIWGPKIFAFQSPDLRPWISSAALIVFFVILCVERLEILERGAINKYMIGLGFVILLMSLSAMSWHLPFYRTSQHLSDFSYSVYLVHFPVLVFALSLCYQVIGSGIRMPFHLGAFLWYLTVLMLSFLASWIISLFTEKKTPVLRSLIYQVLKIEAKP